MPQPSEELTRQKATGDWDEIHEIVRVFTLHREDEGLHVEVTVSRYYSEVGTRYSLSYRRRRDNGAWEEASYGQVISGNDCEEFTILRAISFVNNAHRQV